MRKMRITPTVKPTYVTAALEDGIGFEDIGKPMKVSAFDLYDICADGDEIDGFLVMLEDATADGKQLATIQVDGLMNVELTEAMSAPGGVVAAASAPAGTAEANGLGKVKPATAGGKWKLVSGTGAAGDVTATVMNY